MILSTGLDLCDIRRIEKILARTTGVRFMQRYFTLAERDYIARKNSPAAAYARRWAAKEAIAKALGTGFRDGLHMHQMEILNDANGKPNVILSGRAAELLQNLSSLPGKALAKPGLVHLAMTDEYPYAMAQVIIST